MLKVNMETGWEIGWDWTRWLIGFSFGEKGLRFFYVNIGPLHFGWCDWNYERHFAASGGNKEGK